MPRSPTTRERHVPFRRRNLRPRVWLKKTNSSSSSSAIARSLEKIDLRNVDLNHEPIEELDLNLNSPDFIPLVDSPLVFVLNSENALKVLTTLEKYMRYGGVFLTTEIIRCLIEDPFERVCLEGLRDKKMCAFVPAFMGSFFSILCQLVPEKKLQDVRAMRSNFMNIYYRFCKHGIIIDSEPIDAHRLIRATFDGENVWLKTTCSTIDRDLFKRACSIGLCPSIKRTFAFVRHDLNMHCFVIERFESMAPSKFAAIGANNFSLLIRGIFVLLYQFSLGAYGKITIDKDCLVDSLLIKPIDRMRILVQFPNVDNLEFDKPPMRIKDVLVLAQRWFEEIFSSMRDTTTRENIRSMIRSLFGVHVSSFGSYVYLSSILRDELSKLLQK
jgi:hypothetical protein